METATVSTMPTTTATSEVDRQLTTLREQMKALKAERTALLPRLTTGEREVIVSVEANVETSLESATTAGNLRQNRQFTDEDRDQIQAARLEHKKLINTPEMKAEAAEMIGKAYLASYKLIHRRDGRVGLVIRGQI